MLKLLKILELKIVSGGITPLMAEDLFNQLVKSHGFNAKVKDGIKKLFHEYNWEDYRRSGLDRHDPTFGWFVYNEKKGQLPVLYQKLKLLSSDLNEIKIIGNRIEIKKQPEKFAFNDEYSIEDPRFNNISDLNIYLTDLLGNEYIFDGPDAYDHHDNILNLLKKYNIPHKVHNTSITIPKSATKIIGSIDEIKNIGKPTPEIVSRDIDEFFEKYRMQNRNEEKLTQMVDLLAEFGWYRREYPDNLINDEERYLVFCQQLDKENLLQSFYKGLRKIA